MTSKRRAWLVCKACQTKEWLQPHTPLVGCPGCGRPRYAEDDAGRPLVLWSVKSDPNDWSPQSRGAS